MSRRKFEGGRQRIKSHRLARLDRSAFRYIDRR
jgi:hypothetical protein